jgi:hypothetical protein
MSSFRFLESLIADHKNMGELYGVQVAQLADARAKREVGISTFLDTSGLAYAASH